MTLVRTRRASLAVLLGLSGPWVCAQTYEDKVLDDGPQPVLAAEERIDTARQTGWPRGVRVDLATSQGRGAQNDTTYGLGVSGYLETPDHGALSLSLNASAGTLSQPGLGLERSTRVGLWRIDQRALPLDGGWVANHSLGDLFTPLQPLARGFGRLGLPITPLAGLTAQYQQGDRMQWSVGAGRPGIYSGQSLNGFNAGEGLLGTLGGQGSWRRPGREDSLGIQAISAEGTAGRLLPGTRESVQSVWVGWRQRGLDGNGRVSADSLQWQGNLLASARRGLDPLNLQAPRATSQALGGWLESQWQGDLLRHNAGLFHLQPGLYWGNERASADLRGAYWRGDLLARQWQFIGNLEWTQRLSERSDSMFANGYLTYRLNSRESLGLQMSARTGATAAQSAQLNYSVTSGLGLTQWRAEALQSTDLRVRRLGLDHAFMLGDFSRLSTALGVEQFDRSNEVRRLLTWGLLGSLALGTARLDMNLLGSRGDGYGQVSGNLTAAYPLSRTWSVLLQYTASRTQDILQSVAVSSALSTGTLPAAITPVRLERVSVSLRYEDRAGTSSAPLGGAPGVGAGRLSGTVYFDLDRNGRRDPNESGVPEIAIELDGRYITRTDAQGRYEFPTVVAGPHTVRIITDDVPLPWNPIQVDATPVELRVRSATVVDFPLQRSP